MTVDQVRSLVEQALPWWAHATGSLIALLVVVLLAAFGTWLGAYFHEKGKNLATREDIQTLTAATQRLKAEMAGGLWVKQEQWRLRSELYRTILEEFYEAGNLYAELLQPLFTKVLLSADERRSLDARVERSSDRLRRAVALGRVFLSADSQAVLDRFDATLNRVSTSVSTPSKEVLKQMSDVFRVTREEITRTAKADLLGL